MVLKNLLRRRGRTLLTVLGIGIGVAAIIGLGALADGLEAGYTGVLTGSKADLALSQPDMVDLSMSSVDEEIGLELTAMPEVAEVSGMVQGIVQAEGQPYFFVFGYPEDSFILSRFQIVEGVGLDSREAQEAQGTPILLGSAAAEALHRQVGDTVRLTESVYRVVGIYQTGQALEDGGSVLGLRDAQDLLGKQRQVSLFYIRLKDPSLRERLQNRIARLWPDLLLSTTSDLAEKQDMGQMMRGFMWAIAGLAIVIGGVGMMNSQLMAVMERTREIGVLRAVGWRRWRVLLMILGESVLVGLLGGLIGTGIGWLALYLLTDQVSAYGVSSSTIRPGLLIDAFSVVLTLGLIGGLYPAWRAARLQPVEALRYEGGSGGGKARHLPVGGMAAQGLWRRLARTLLTLGGIGITVGAIMALEATVRGFTSMLTGMASGAEIMVRQSGVSDTSYSAVDERIGDRIASMPEVSGVSGFVLSAIAMPEGAGYFLVFGYAPNEAAIQDLRMVEGERISTNHQIMLGRNMADALHKEVGETIILSETRFRIVGIYEASGSWEELGGVVTLRDAQTFVGRPRKVTLYLVDVDHPAQAERLVERINAEFPEVHAALSGEFADQMPDMQASYAMLDGISFLAILVGGVGMMNTMLMAVLERTREIGVFRALGWRRRAILGLILREALLLGLLGGGVGIGIAFGLSGLLMLEPSLGSVLIPSWEWDVFARAILVALLLGLVGGLYPAYRATRLQPVEALRYE